MTQQLYPPSVPLGVFQVTIDAAAKTLEELIVAAGGTLHEDAQHFDLVPEGGDIRWRDDGTAPTAAIGMKVVADDVIGARNDKARMRDMQFIRTGGADVTAMLWVAG